MADAGRGLRCFSWTLSGPNLPNARWGLKAASSASELTGLSERTLQEKRAYMKQWREKRIQAGLCTYCGQPNPTKFRLCEDCRKIRNSWPSRQHDVLNAQFARARAKLGEQYAARLQRYRLDAKLRVIEMFGGRCVVCWERNPLVLTLNHIDGYRGARPENGSRGGWPLYMKILNGEESRDKYDLRCYNCQIIYEFQRGKIFAKIQGEVRSAIEKIGTMAWGARDPISTNWN